jgi:hypothetical protein
VPSKANVNCQSGPEEYGSCILPFEPLSGPLAIRHSGRLL